jgi:hypothetical protein
LLPADIIAITPSNEETNGAGRVRSSWTDLCRLATIHFQHLPPSPDSPGLDEAFDE